MTFLLGRQAMFGHAPPIYFRSTTAVRLPSLAIVQAANLPAVPPPSTRASKLSGAFTKIHLLKVAALSSEALLEGRRVIWILLREKVAALHRRCVSFP